MQSKSNKGYIDVIRYTRCFSLYFSLLIFYFNAPLKKRQDSRIDLFCKKTCDFIFQMKKTPFNYVKSTKFCNHLPKNCVSIS